MIAYLKNYRPAACRRSFVRGRITRQRRGITITEALSSIAVAAVGLFAVLAVIPFAALQAEAGLDLDAAVTIGKNAFHEFDVRGMGNGRNWRVALREGIGMNPSVNNVAPTLSEVRGKPFVIDPLFVTNNFSSIDVSISDPPADPEVAWFPFPLYQAPGGATASPPRQEQGILRFNLAANGTPLNFAQAESIFRSANELVFDEPADKLNLPPQRFKLLDPADVTSDRLKRQYQGDITWMALVVPEFHPADVNKTNVNPHSFRLYVIVFKNRQINYRKNSASGEAVFTANFFNRRGDGGGAVELTLVPEAALPTAGLRNQMAPDDYLNSGDWMLLTDYAQLQNDGSVVTNGQVWRWYQIQRVETTGKNNRAGTRLNLTGPDWTGQDIDLTTPEREARAIVLSNVIAVYEKTIRIEYDSVWNE